MSIGETLTRARQQAGLTVADVSARTRIRESLISSIEHDEFGPCGGDFYARGHIRAIAAVVGADQDALIGEYDAAHPSASPVTLEELPDWPPQRRRRRPSWMWLGMVVLLAVIAVAAYQLASGATSKPAPETAPTMPVASQTPARSPAPSPEPPRPSSTPVQVSQLTPVSAAAFGPAGTSDGDNPQNASLALSGDPANPWHTSWYTTARFGNLQAGTGLLLDLGHLVTITGAVIRLGDTSGADLQLRAGVTAARFVSVASRSDAGGLVRVALGAQVRARYLLIWFTLLPPDNAGTYQADISSVTVTALRQ